MTDRKLTMRMLEQEIERTKLCIKLRDRVALLEAALIHEYDEEWDVGDAIADEAKVQFLIDRIPK